MLCPRMACFCSSLRFLGPIKLHHLLKLCGHKFLTHVLMEHRCQTILLLPPSWMVWTVLCGIYQIPRSCQTGCHILEYKVNGSSLGWWVSGQSTYQRIGPQSKWGCPHFHHNVLLTLWIYTLVHWWLNNMNCEVLSRHTLSLSLIISSSSCHHNRCLPCCPSCTSQYNLPCGLMHQVLGVWMPWASSNNDAVTIPLP